MAVVPSARSAAGSRRSGSGHPSHGVESQLKLSSGQGEHLDEGVARERVDLGAHEVAHARLADPEQACRGGLGELGSMGQGRRQRLPCGSQSDQRNTIRHWSFRRIECRPRRSPRTASSGLPGGTRGPSMRASTSSIRPRISPRPAGPRTVACAASLQAIRHAASDASERSLNQPGSRSPVLGSTHTSPTSSAAAAHDPALSTPPPCDSQHDSLPCRPRCSRSSSPPAPRRRLQRARIKPHRRHRRPA